MNIVKKHITTDYFPSSKDIQRIIYHFTAGNMPGCETWLGQPDKINVPYILQRDGQFNEYFDVSKFRAHHTGVGLSEESFGLEIENWGPLKMMWGYLMPWTEWGKTKETMDMRKAVSPERALFVKNGFRGIFWFELLTKAQEEVLGDWTRLMIDTYPTINRLQTHAEINSNKTDFPPTFKQVYDVIDAYTDYIARKKDNHLGDIQIPEGQEHTFSKAAIQQRINYLVKKFGWNNPELNRLIKYRNLYLK